MSFASPQARLHRWWWLSHGCGLFVCITAVAVIHVLVTKPIENRYTEVTRAIAQAEQVLTHEHRLRRENQRLSDSLLKTDDEIEGILNRIPNGPCEADFLGQMTALAHEVGLEIVDYHPNETITQPEYREMRVTIASEGPYAAICEFLYRIKDLPRLSKVNALTIKPRHDGEVFSMDMTLAIYFAPATSLSTLGDHQHGS
ncbi:type IV pilus inner membrane component PilO [Aporhodopirellula aestuarii]|uniref:Type 4a pilus biogenesis protein PilO n=1 Tax=Aporhodopirellula aestuarii TaxID=2950107 RepID=A0ABT0U9L9_9BACT|nr:type 4a pilus biogenesis protein PilO [Aporhodopirellula aestuarii]MCM2373595.1 type 4a pilus biogenesis protein PilO [Aporhodopirellula aestuarii]